MKTKWIGLLLLLVVALGAVGYVWFSDALQVTEIKGYVGGEKIGLLEDEAVQDILRDRYKLSLDYAREGSIEMVTMDSSGQNFLFPSNQTALELYEQNFGAPQASEIIFNTPIVLYTHAAVADALKAQNIAQESGGITTVDMEAFTELIESGTEWADIGLPALYGTVSVGTTDPGQVQLRQHVCRASGQHFGGRRGRGRRPARGAAAAAGDLSAARVHGKLLLGPVRPVFEDGHGREAAHRRI